MAKTKTIAISLTLLTVPLLLAAQTSAPGKKASGQEWQKVFDVNKADLADKGINTYFILEPGYKLHYKHNNETLVIKVLDDSKLVDGVKTRIVEERETSGGQLAEISRNYYAIDQKSKAVYYFGEDVDDYKDGKVVGHAGAWLAGVKDAKFGLMMPGEPKVGQKFYQEIAPDVAMDRSEIVSVTAKLTTPAGTFKNCLHAREGSSLESGTSDKWYAPGVGLIKDDELVLVKIEKPVKEEK
jgi:hypothetical protein